MSIRDLTIKDEPDGKASVTYSGPVNGKWEEAEEITFHFDSREGAEIFLQAFDTYVNGITTRRTA